MISFRICKVSLLIHSLMLAICARFVPGQQQDAHEFFVSLLDMANVAHVTDSP
jgi:hypothetical protein